MTELTLFCMVQGQTTSFPVDILSTKTVGHLKQLICTPARFPHITPEDLTLWRADIPLADAKEDVRLLMNVINNTSSLMEDADISAVFPEGAIKGRLHIIVQNPDSAPKRDREDDALVEANRTKRRRSSENRQPFIASDGQSVALPPFLVEMLEGDLFKPSPRGKFAELLTVQAGSQITTTTMSLGQTPKYFGQGTQGGQFFVTEQMMEVWELLANDTEFPIKKVLSGPMGVGKSYLAWFLAAKAYASGWPVLYFADASRLDKETSEESSLEICKRFLALNRNVLTAADLRGMLGHGDSAPLVVTCAGNIFGSLLQRRDRKSLLIVDEHGALFTPTDPVPNRLVVLRPLQYLNHWMEQNAGARVVFTGTAHAKYERTHLTDMHHLIFVGPLSPTIFGQLQEAVFSQLHPMVLHHLSAIKGEVLRITNCVPRELVNLARDIGTAPLSLEEIKERLRDFEYRRRRAFFQVIETRYNKLNALSAEGTRLALADMFLPGKKRPTAVFDLEFLDFGVVYRYLGRNGIVVLHSPISPAAQDALMDLYKLCPLPEAYRNGLARDTLDGAQFEDALFQQLLRSSDLILEATDLAGENALVMNLKISQFQLLQEPPRFFGTDSMDILMRCYEGYPRFDFILGYTFIQVSVSPFTTHDKDSAKIDKAFDDRTPGGKNQIEEYLDAMFGGTHKAVIQCTPRGRAKFAKKFVVSKDGMPCPQFKIVYIRGSPAGKPNHTGKAQEYPDLRHISYEEIKLKLLGVAL